MNKLALALALIISSTCCLANNNDTKPFYLTHGNDIYQIHDNKAYKVEIIDNKWYTTNQWFPLDQYGYTEEHVQKVKERQAHKANQFIKQNRGY